MENVENIAEKVKEEIIKNLGADGEVTVTEIKAKGIPEKVNVYSFDINKSEYSLASSARPAEMMNTYFSDNNILDHPEDRYILSALSKKEPNHAAAIEIKALTVAMPGWTLLNDKGGKVKKLLEKPNTNLCESFDDILYRLQLDFEIFDDAYMEIITVGKSPEEMSLYHVNARNVFVEPRKRSNGSYYVGLVKKYHYLLEVMQVLSSSSFTPLTRDTVIKPKTNYLGRLGGYTPRSSFYGLPCYLAAIGSIAENIVIKQYIYSFFENNASPAIAILITGSELSPKNQKEIKDHIDKMKGPSKSHSILVLSIADTNAKIEIKEIQKSVDAHFLQEREVNRTEILQTHLVPPKLLGIGSPGGLSSGSEMIGAMKEFLEIIIKPKQRKLARFVNIILEKLFGFDPHFEFLPYDLTNEKDDAIIFSLLSKIVDKEGNPVMTVQEIREKIKMSREISGNKMDNNKEKNPVNESGDNRPGEPIDESGNPAGDVGNDLTNK